MLSSPRVDRLTILPQMDKFNKKNINMKKIVTSFTVFAWLLLKSM